MSHVDEGVVHAYLDGELSTAERAALEAHVAECPACRALLADARALVERASQLLAHVQPAERPAPPLHQLRKPRVVWRMRVPLAWAASVVLAFVVGYNLRIGPPAAPQAIVGADDSIYYFRNDQETAGPADGYSMRASPQPVSETPAAPAELARRQRGDRQSDQDARGFVTRDAPETDKLAAAPAPQPGMAAPPPPTASVRTLKPEQVPTVRDTVAREPIYLLDGAVGVADLRGRQLATEWPIIRRGSARQLLGVDPLGIPGLPVRDIRSSPTGDGTVLVQQVIDSTTVIQLFQRPALALAQREEAAEGARRSTAAAAPANRLATDRLARFVGGLRIEIAGPLTQDSLNRLLESVKPLP